MCPSNILDILGMFAGWCIAFKKDQFLACNRTNKNQLQFHFHRLKGRNFEAVGWLSIYMGSDCNPFVLFVEISLKLLHKLNDPS